MNALMTAGRSPKTLDDGHAAVAQRKLQIMGWTVRKSALFWILQCAGWLAFGAVMFAWGLEYWSVGDALANKAILVLTGFVLTLAGRWLYRQARARSIPLAASIFLVGTFSFAGAALWYEVESILFHIYYTREMSFAPVVISIGTLLYDGFVLLAWSLLNYGINGWIELEKERSRATRAEALAHAARLQALQSQLEPHFMFNTLNAISTLVVEGKNADAARMIARLSDFLRLTLDSAERAEISVAEELEFVRRYLEIEQVRFGDRLRVTITASPEAMQGMVPTLLLQPLVENAVKHGVLPREQGGAVTVTIARNDGRLRISVSDDGAGLPLEAGHSPGVGLSNTVARLEELYGDHSRFSLGASGQGGVSATIEIPFRTAPPGVDARKDDDRAPEVRE